MSKKQIQVKKCNINIQLAGAGLLSVSQLLYADGILPGNVPDAALINEGRELFFNETFLGNGRTCGTCHPENNNFTLDPEFIATLPKDDPLFIAERPEPNPLAHNFEKPKLMRELGLILENTNGFDDLENNFTLRSVSHVLALPTSLTPPTAAADDGTTVAPVERTGWSGDGSPVGFAGTNGSLRDFTQGAIRQHFPKSLGREEGVDFRLATDHELDALEAYMLSLGRQQEYDDFSSIQLTDAKSEQGRLNYIGEGLPQGSLNCNACHFNGGANTDPDFDFPESVTPAAFELSNRSFAPRVEELLDQPGDSISRNGELPFDDGFADGTDLFNVPTVIEAADTGPFFHSNQIDTVEGMVGFYATKRHLRNGEVLDAIVPLNGSQVVNVAAFIRVLNADENLRSALQLISQSEQMSGSDAEINRKMAESQIIDAIEVLQGGKLHFVEVQPKLKSALHDIQQQRFRVAKEKLRQCRDAMIIRPGQKVVEGLK